jgi:hypothetical protein
VFTVLLCNLFYIYIGFIISFIIFLLILIGVWSVLVEIVLWFVSLRNYGVPIRVAARFYAFSTTTCLLSGSAALYCNNK